MNQGDIHPLLGKLVGRWKGVCRTWFEPEVLADQSEVVGHFTPMFRGQFVRHTYSSQLQGKSRQGEELVAINSITRQAQVAWIDDFHMNYAIMFSVGEQAADGFSVVGHYDVAADQPPWGWRTVYQLASNQLIITAYNIFPDGTEAKAIETVYQREGR